MYATELLILLITFFGLSYYLLVKRPKNFPPGPVGWPIVGNLLQFGHLRHLTFIEWGKQYGDILGLYTGPHPTVILNNYKHIKEAFAENVWAGKLATNMIKDRSLGGNRGLLFSDGRNWTEQRRFCLKTLRDFGFGKKSMESMVMEEVNELIASFKKQAGKPITTQNRFNVAVLNALWQILTGERFSHDDPRLENLINALTSTVTKRPISSVLAEFIPAVYRLRKMFPSFFRSVGQKFQMDTFKLIKETIQQHKDTLQEGLPRDFIDVYLTEMKRTTDTGSSFYQQEGEKGLLLVLLDLFIAGAETTSTTLTWSFLILALHPEKQDKMFDEIKKVVGLSRHVSLADRPQLPYLEATILETMRLSAIVALGVPHKTLEAVEFHGYTIPKNTIVMSNVYSASRDKQAWGDPDNFRPERFLSPDGNSLVRNEAFMPFSVGKRVCLGETLARDELFLFMGNLFQNIQVTTVPGEKKPTLDSHGFVVLTPNPHRLVVVDRQQ